jgi:EasF-like predicted methyltransferase
MTVTQLASIVSSEKTILLSSNEKPTSQLPDDSPLFITNITNIKEPLDLYSATLEGLQSSEPFLPELLLWNDAGQRLFQAFSETPTYYPMSKELDILTSEVNEMVQNLPQSSTIIELGAGSLRKTSIILSACEQRGLTVSYYALDVSWVELTDAVSSLQAKFAGSKYISIYGLRGTYEDGVSWLKHHFNQLSHHPTPTSTPGFLTFLWMGNSMANLEIQSSQDLLSSFARVCDQIDVPHRFMISIDGQDEPSKVLEAYNPELPALRGFILNGLEHANSVLGTDIFQPSEWTCGAKFDPAKHQLEMFYTPIRDVTCTISPGPPLTFRKGTEISAIISRKWPYPYMRSIMEEIELNVSQFWQAENSKYCFYCLERPVV